MADLNMSGNDPARKLAKNMAMLCASKSSRAMFVVGRLIIRPGSSGGAGDGGSAVYLIRSRGDSWGWIAME
jgi:hypothetical protein